MKSVSVDEVESHFATYLEQSQTEGPIVITENGKAIAVLLRPENDEDLERLILGRSPRFQALLDQSRASIRAGNGLARDAFWAAVEQRHRARDPADQG
jgi:PHD/YefM family antitoxin component YafN of YafNO toxin-antitoxin module